jgi:peptidoglycan/xylan/chitin deacetylase (PgdA/CDA1 family)
MHAGLSAVLAALDAARSPVQIFLRDDDAGWDDARLYALLDCTERHGVPIDLAVIPQACGDALAVELCARIDAAPGRIGVHQHGFTHANHEAAGRKCEFGGARSMADQRGDLRHGRERLQACFGTRLDATFTPPWNRCSPATPALLAQLGYSTLSRDRTAPAQQALPELPVAIDWCKLQRLARAQNQDGGEHIGVECARRIRTGETLGIMLHHAQMDQRDLAFLDALLATTGPHPQARWALMREIKGVKANGYKPG